MRSNAESGQRDDEGRWQPPVDERRAVDGATSVLVSSAIRTIQRPDVVDLKPKA
jgi:hypothetical protein